MAGKDIIKNMKEYIVTVDVMPVGAVRAVRYAPAQREWAERAERAERGAERLVPRDRHTVEPGYYLRRLRVYRIALYVFLILLHFVTCGGIFNRS